jgi:predicted GIY-YIG superfamily endonuclease
MEVEYIPERPISIYALICPITDDVKYIGATYDVKRRFKSHINDKRKTNKKNIWLDELKTKGLVPRCCTLKVFNNRMEAQEAEQFFINKFRDTVLNGDRKLKLPDSTNSNSLNDKFKVSFYLTKEQLIKVTKILREESLSLDHSFTKIITEHKVDYKYNNNEKVKWVNTEDSNKIDL